MTQRSAVVIVRRIHPQLLQRAQQLYFEETTEQLGAMDLNSCEWKYRRFHDTEQKQRGEEAKSSARSARQQQAEVRAVVRDLVRSVVRHARPARRGGGGRRQHGGAARHGGRAERECRACIKRMVKQLERTHARVDRECRWCLNRMVRKLERDHAKEQRRGDRAVSATVHRLVHMVSRCACCACSSLRFARIASSVVWCFTACLVPTTHIVVFSCLFRYAMCMHVFLTTGGASRAP